ncbi:MAG TPA: fumarylacetoacetase [Croceibacterium sp.]|nr:fumarylacetoacetase [Croceibacterium sp.]
MDIDHTHDPQASSWVPGADGHPDFPVQNLPLGVFSRPGQSKAIGSAIGDRVVDLGVLAQRVPSRALAAALGAETLNGLFALPSAARLELRRFLFETLTDETHREGADAWLLPAANCELHLPFRVGDYTDFYVGIHHATNIGKQFRPDNPLLPNYKHIPIGYHGRASSVRVSGTPVARPLGQLKSPDRAEPIFGPTGRLDYELELGAWIAGENELGERVPLAQAWDRIGGLSLLNDWSARDIQAWEYQPLGPFLAKNFLSTVSPWVVTAEALAPFRVPQPARPQGDPQPLPYLTDPADRQRGALSLRLEAFIRSEAMRTAGMAPHKLSSGPATNMYWTFGQMVTHHTSNGCDLHAGDLLGSGTISGPDPDAFGSLMELSQGGKQPIELPTGEVRGFLEDGDELILSAFAEREGFRPIGLGTCSGVVAPARR